MEEKSQFNPFFTIVSWNILHRVHEGGDEYPHCKRSDLLWSNRLNRIQRKLLTFSPKPDFICLQELDKNTFFDPTKTNNCLNNVNNNNNNHKQSLFDSKSGHSRTNCKHHRQRM